MNRNLKRALSAVAYGVLMCVCTIFGQTASTTSPAAKTSIAKPSAAKAVIKTFHGTIASINADTLEVSVIKNNQTILDKVYADNKTIIKRGNAAIPIAELKSGDAVQIQYRDEKGTMIAVRITEKQATGSTSTVKKESTK